MNVHERIRKTLDHEETDRISILVQTFEKPFISKVYNSIGTKKIFQYLKLKPFHQLNCAKILGIDAICFILVCLIYLIKKDLKYLMK